MSSLNGKLVALKVKEAVRSGKIVNKYQAQLEAGYSKQSAKALKGVRTKGYRDEMKGFLEKLTAERDRILDAMSDKNLVLEDHKDLARSFDILNKNVNLLKGRPTENTKITLNTEEAEELNKLIDENDL